MHGAQMKKGFGVLSVCCTLVVAVAGCAPGNQAGATNAASYVPPSRTTSDVAQVVRSTYHAKSKTVDLYLNRAEATGPEMDFSKENLMNVKRPDGIVNYALGHYPTQDVQTVTVHDQTAQGQATKSIAVAPVLAADRVQGASDGNSPASALAAGTSGQMSLPPAGARMDTGIRPIAGLFASRANKVQAVLTVARSKLGTPYIWGHNEDRGQYGFDCSNFTAYVYHHALGYIISGASRNQYQHVGTSVSKASMQPGDLLVFENGAHVGIFVGNNRMIEEGGGLGKVGYLSVAPGSYWGNHLTVVKRMF